VVKRLILIGIGLIPLGCADATSHKSPSSPENGSAPDLTAARFFIACTGISRAGGVSEPASFTWIIDERGDDVIDNETSERVCDVLQDCRASVDPHTIRVTGKAHKSSQNKDESWHIVFVIDRLRKAAESKQKFTISEAGKDKTSITTGSYRCERRDPMHQPI
jgi:hypothetical protein